MTLVTDPRIEPRRGLRLIALAALLVLVGADGVFAQFSSRQSSILTPPGRSFGRARSPFTSRPAFTSRPTFSPYLNLLRPGDPVLNYYGLVRPEKELRAANDQLRKEVGEVERELESDKEREAESKMGVTGHRVKFLSDQYGGADSVSQTLSDRDARRRTSPRRTIRLWAA